MAHSRNAYKLWRQTTMLRLTMGLSCIFAFTPACPWGWPPHGGFEDHGEDHDDEHDDCTWDLDAHSFPINVRMPAQDALGEITFDGNCDLIMSGGEDVLNVYRAHRDDGSVALLVAKLPHTFISGMTYRASDNRVYISAGDPDQIYAFDDQDQLEAIAALPAPAHSLTVAPEGFREFGDFLIAVTHGPPQLLAIDLNAEPITITPFAQSTDPLSVATFGSDGTLYVAEYSEGRVSTVTANGTFTTFHEGLDAPDGLAVSPD